MALSNWDTLGIDQDGKLCFGIDTAKDCGVEVYKNWIYVRDISMWREGTFSSPTIAEIQEGEVTLSDFYIYAERCELQRAVFCFVRLRDYTEKKRRWFAGIGCCGYDDETDRVCAAMGIDTDRYEVLYHTEDGRDKDDPEQDLMAMEHVYIYGCRDKQSDDPDNEIEFSIPYSKYEELESRYVGVLPETYQAFLQFLNRHRSDMSVEQQEWLNKLRSGEIVPRRFNQGDKFFSDNWNTPPEELEESRNLKPMESDELTPVSEIGSTPETPIFMKVLGKE